MPERETSNAALQPASIRPPEPDVLRAAGEALRAGQLVAIPTETVYGLGADATNANAVARIFAAKGRPSFNPLIVHVLSLEQAERLAVVTPTARKLAHAFWPGPLTLVLERAPDCRVAELASAGLSTLALRVPSHEVARALIAAAGVPLAAPSANRSGHVTATRAEHVAQDLAGAVSVIVDGGPAQHGLESTVVDATGEHVVLLRPGAVSVAQMEAVLGEAVRRAGDMSAKPASPGQLESHYAPRAQLRLDAQDVHPGEALLAFGATVPATQGAVLNLSPRGDLTEAAANLFAHLRALDAGGPGTIAVMPVPREGLGEAINDRLRRAAAPRP